jgi:hypothetical protein
MAIDFTFSTDVSNPKGTVRLVTALELYAKVPDATDPTIKHQVPIGIAQEFTQNEQRPVIYNWVLGNRNPSRPRDLIPGVITQSTLRLSMVALYTANGLGLLSIPNPATQAIAPALPYNKRPFDLVERWFNAATGVTVYELIYVNCFASDLESRKIMQSGDDLRVMDGLTVHYQDMLFVPSSDFETQIATGTFGNPFTE